MRVGGKVRECECAVVVESVRKRRTAVTQASGICVWSSISVSVKNTRLGFHPSSSINPV